MYKHCFLKNGISEILFYKRLDQVFALKCSAKLFNSKPFNQLSFFWPCLCYITTSAVLIRFLNLNLGGEAVILFFCSIQGLFIRYICAKFGIPKLPQSPDIGQNSDMGISNIWISGQPILNRNCRNSRTSNDIQMKLKPVTKLDKRNTATLTMAN